MPKYNIYTKIESNVSAVDLFYDLNVYRTDASNKKHILLSVAQQPVTSNYQTQSHETNDTEDGGNDSNLLIVFYVQIVPDDFVMQLHRFGERQGLPAQPCQMLSQIQVVSLNSLRVTLTDDVQFSLQT